jgi:hypothetical protein
VFHPADFKVHPQNNITSFVNCFPSASIFDFDWHQFLEVEKSMPDFSFKSLGGGGRDGNANGQNEVADRMREAMFVWHVKFGGDGYGHIIHNAAAVGRPAIVRKSYYQHKMAETLMQDDLTCIAIDGLSVDQIIYKVRYYSDPIRYKKMAECAHVLFTRNVNFDEEADQIGSFFESIFD